MDKEQPSDKTVVTEEPINAEEPRVSDIGFLLSVSDDKLEAYITPKRAITPDDTLGDIKELLENEGITYGIVDDSLISEYLTFQPVVEKPWLIANGKAPEAGIEPEIKYYFDTDPLTIGTLNESGDMDYKDRGEIPQVKKGDLIAEKIPGKDGRAGFNIYGQTIHMAKTKDIKLLCSKGAEISEDGLKILATIDGRPELADNGRLSVSPVLQISGDVCLETGHIDFDGDIYVNGSVQNGFRISGESLHAKEILKAEIDIAGNITVSGGIIGAHIKIGGQLKAMYIHDTRVVAGGDIDVGKDVFASTIETNGTCTVNRGKILSSLIAAKKGITAKEIGSHMSSPCILTVGIDTIAKNEIDDIKKQIEEKKEEQKKIKSFLSELQQEFDKLDKEIGKKSQEEDYAMGQQIALNKKLEELQKVNCTIQTAKVQGIKLQGIKEHLDGKILQLQKAVENLFNKQDAISEKISSYQIKIRTSEKEVENLEDAINKLIESLQVDPKYSFVKISGTLGAQTNIIGPNSTFIAKEDLRHVRIREFKISEPDSSIYWTMKISPLKGA